MGSTVHPGRCRCRWRHGLHEHKTFSSPPRVSSSGARFVANDPDSGKFDRSRVLLVAGTPVAGRRRHWNLHGVDARWSLSPLLPGRQPALSLAGFKTQFQSLSELGTLERERLHWIAGSGALSFATLFLPTESVRLRQAFQRSSLVRFPGRLYF